jgi:hypothetical protein
MYTYHHLPAHTGSYERVKIYRPHPEEAALLGGRLEGWPLARPCPWPSFETAAQEGGLLRMRADIV